MENYKLFNLILVYVDFFIRFYHKIQYPFSKFTTKLQNITNLKTWNNVFFKNAHDIFQNLKINVWLYKEDFLQDSGYQKKFCEQDIFLFFFFERKSFTFFYPETKIKKKSFHAPNMNFKRESNFCENWTFMKKAA